MHFNTLVGHSHSLKRYISFGLIAGLAGAVLSSVLTVDLYLVTPILAFIAAWLAGIEQAN